MSGFVPGMATVGNPRNRLRSCGLGNPYRGDVMEGRAQARSRIVGQENDFVVRRFSAARIERLLLTRLFDLTTGRHVPGELGGLSSVLSSCSQTVETVGERREAA